MFSALDCVYVATQGAGEGHPVNIWVLPLLGCCKATFLTQGKLLKEHPPRQNYHEYYA